MRSSKGSLIGSSFIGLVFYYRAYRVCNKVQIGFILEFRVYNKV